MNSLNYIFLGLALMGYYIPFHIINDTDSDFEKYAFFMVSLCCVFMVYASAKSLFQDQNKSQSLIVFFTITSIISLLSDCMFINDDITFFATGLPIIITMFMFVAIYFPGKKAHGDDTEANEGAGNDFYRQQKEMF